MRSMFQFRKGFETIDSLPNLSGSELISPQDVNVPCVTRASEVKEKWGF